MVRSVLCGSWVRHLHLDRPDPRMGAVVLREHCVSAPDRSVLERYSGPGQRPPNARLRHGLGGWRGATSLGLGRTCLAPPVRAVRQGSWAAGFSRSLGTGGSLDTCLLSVAKTGQSAVETGTACGRTAADIVSAVRDAVPNEF